MQLEYAVAASLLQRREKDGCHGKPVSAQDQKAEKTKNKASLWTRLNSITESLVWQLVFNQKTAFVQEIYT